ncbi:inorganic phosphate transporter Pho86p [[Candida] railenensis]|uniref:Inorganic phosphate transporter Pho86p n=1 Tax=[Candida] railenensis TaxID=45579 RepID=A0A9P0QKS2_9ASCO|nr:inorganic phosphate transporter Pho86p [[Candida] railenensis]
MAPQTPLNLNEPLSKDSKSTLEQVPLTPELATAGLTLHGDYYRQSQAKFNKYLVWHPYSLAFVAAATSIYGYLQFAKVIAESSSFWEFLYSPSTISRAMITLPGVLFGLACVGLFSHLVSDDFKTITDNLEISTYSTAIFGFDLIKFANLPIFKKLSDDKAAYDNGENTSVIIYRDSPIAIATVTPLEEQSDESNFVVQISGLHVRKVFAKVDFDEMLLEWALTRAKFLANTNPKYKDAKVTVLTDAYSFDSQRIKLLKSNFFEKVKSSRTLNPFSTIIQAEKELEGLVKKKNPNTNSTFFGIRPEVLTSIFDASRITYSLTINRKVPIEEIK